MIGLWVDFNMALSKLVHILVALPRSSKKALVLSADVVLGLATSWLAFSLRYDEIVSLSEPVLWAGFLALILFIPIFVKLGLYRAIYRFSGWFAAQSMITAALIYGIAYFILVTIIGIPGVPRSIGIIQPILFFSAVGLLRLLAKSLLSKSIYKKGQVKVTRYALIYGAGSAGRQIVSGLRQGIEVEPVGFVDDNLELCGGLILGLPVYHPSQIQDLIVSDGVTEILLAIPSASRTRQKEILAILSDLPVHVRTLPGLSDLANGVVKIEDMLEIQIDDVLGRESVKPYSELLLKNIAGKVVLVTGAGGSIGSELCRQVVTNAPKLLVLYDLSEFALYAIERELVQLNGSVQIIPVLGSVLDSRKLSRAIKRFAVQTVYHAAAYKHVPMIEINPAAGVWNNVFGTLRAVEAACCGRVETFVLISTDKAVRPTNVMGCTKRVAELVLQAKSMQECGSEIHTTKLTMVRFGNVLGSSGSVVPAFREQIRKGGPVTVTHPEIIRYFMTIPEAAQLVIQAGAMGEGGDVMLLDMGNPVKIVDLAKRMIHLSGFSHKDEANPDGDIEICFTGLRTGEKLYEELLIGEHALPTPHPRIMRATEHALSWIELEPYLFELELAVKTEDLNAIYAVLKKVVPEFDPQLVNEHTEVVRRTI